MQPIMLVLEEASKTQAVKDFQSQEILIEIVRVQVLVKKRNRVVTIVPKNVRSNIVLNQLVTIVLIVRVKKVLIVLFLKVFL